MVGWSFGWVGMELGGCDARGGVPLVFESGSEIWEMSGDDMYAFGVERTQVLVHFVRCCPPKKACVWRQQLAADFTHKPILFFPLSPIHASYS